jgi:hypothetical protein
VEGGSQRVDEAGEGNQPHFRSQGDFLAGVAEDLVSAELAPPVEATEDSTASAFAAHYRELFAPEGEPSEHESAKTNPWAKLKTTTKALVDEFKKTSHNGLMLDRPNFGDAALEQEQSQFVQLARKIGFAAAGKLLVGAASPEEQCALITGMAACAREVTSPEPPTAPVAAEPAPEPTQETKPERWSLSAKLSKP